ncbi:hypothetical protein [Massilia eurypsychrophila]|jgi:hypothetical protein|nr:hypothetical protein [Massilia eurypsychrophila]
MKNLFTATKVFVDAVHTAFGMWKDRDDIPSDGLEYERRLRGKCT